MRTVTRAIHRQTRRRLSAVSREEPTAWVNDEEFEILESGIICDDTSDPLWSSRHTINC